VPRKPGIWASLTVHGLALLAVCGVGRARERVLKSEICLVLLLQSRGCGAGRATLCCRCHFSEPRRLAWSRSTTGPLEAAAAAAARWSVSISRRRRARSSPEPASAVAAMHPNVSTGTFVDATHSVHLRGAGAAAVFRITCQTVYGERLSIGGLYRRTAWCDRPATGRPISY